MVRVRTKTRGLGVALATACLAFLPTASAVAGLTPAAKCEALKNKEAGKYAFCLQKAEMKLVKTAGACSTSGTACYRDDECSTGETCSKDMGKYNSLVAKCDQKFSDDWSKWEEKASGSCPTIGDEDSRQAELTANADRTAWILSGRVRFTDNGDGTITDNQTGLTWEKKVKLDTVTDYANLEDADNTYQWAGVCSSNTSKTCQPDAAAAASCTAGAEGNSTSCGQCTGPDGTCTVGGIGTTAWQWINQLNTLAFAGHSDWRVPTRDELVSIVDYDLGTAPLVDSALQGASCGSSCVDINDPACSCTAPDFYWSASSYSPSPDAAWHVYFADGGVNGSGPPDQFHVRAVRGG